MTFCFGISVSALWRIYTLPVLPVPVVDLTTPLEQELNLGRVYHPISPTDTSEIKKDASRCRILSR